MPDPTGVLYADTSALVKLAVEEPETQALRIELNRWDMVATSVVTEIELTPRGCPGSRVLDDDA